jgi:hypothetical protein
MAYELFQQRVIVSLMFPGPEPLQNSFCSGIRGCLIAHGGH